jgi:hypothetical protein
LSYIREIANQIRRETPPEVLPDGDLDLLFLFYAVLAVVKGPLVEAADVHAAWAAWMARTDDAHRSLVPFEELSDDARRQDDPFVEAIRRVAARHAP